MNDLIVLQIVADSLACITSIIVPVVALVFYLRTRTKEREKETYDYVDSVFLEYLRICFENPELDIFDVSHAELEGRDISKKELIAFTFLLSNFERAYILYKTKVGKSDRDQWSGWEATIRNFFRREKFRQAWYLNGFGWDDSFINYMDKTLSSTLFELFQGNKEMLEKELSLIDSQSLLEEIKRDLKVNNNREYAKFLEPRLKKQGISM